MSNEFYGAGYIEERDHSRLKTKSQRVFEIMKDGQWWTLSDLEKITGSPQASISAYIRGFRRQANGGHTVERKYAQNGLYLYRLILNESLENIEDTSGKAETYSTIVRNSILQAHFDYLNQGKEHEK